MCQYPGSPHAILEAQQHILKAHAERLSKEQGEVVTIEDILAGHAPRPRVLDMFAGGGTIPLEALRLGCEAFAIDLNPVAHVIQLCTLVYPQKFGKPDSNARGMTGQKDNMGEATWGELTEEIRYWGRWILEKARTEIGDLYSLIPDPEVVQSARCKESGVFGEHQRLLEFANDSQQRLKLKNGDMMPVAYLWTRTVCCKNPGCGASVPLVKQTWLCKKADRYVALKMIVERGEKRVSFQVVEAPTAAGLGFDPEAFSKAGNATCPFCNTVADADYVQAEGCAKRTGLELMAAVCSREGKKGKVYISANDLPGLVEDETAISMRLKDLCSRTGLSVPNEPISAVRPSPNARGMSAVTRHGLNNFGDLFTTRQKLCLLTFVAGVREAMSQMKKEGLAEDRRKALATFLGAILDRLVDFNSSACVFNYTGGRGVVHTFGRHAIPMVWDFAETNPFNPDGASWVSGVEDLPKGLRDAEMIMSAKVSRGSATSLPFSDCTFDAVITDPPYYDNVPYADISDFFYVWLKRTIGDLYPEHFASELTPKRTEATALSSRHDGDMSAAEAEYELLMSQAFAEANRVLKPAGQMTVVYAHKTTLGWATLVEALRKTGFTVTEAWPLDTEKKGRLLAQGTAALASSIFLTARKRNGAKIGSYEEQVSPELEEIVRERVGTLWDMGISGADLVIASVGAGLRAFTRFARVEYANGEEVPAERFLTEVETVVLETILGRLSREVGSKGGQYSLASLDIASRFYILWRYTYGSAELDAGEAIIFANGTHVELDGQQGLTASANALVEKKKSNYRLRDYTERGENDNLGLATENGRAAPLIDILHRTLWLMEKRPTELGAFLSEAQPNREQLRLAAQVLGGPGLKGGEMGGISPTAELSALGKLTANWQSVIENAALTIGEREEKKTGQTQLL